MRDNKFSVLTALKHGNTEAAFVIIKHHSYNIYERYPLGLTALHLCCIFVASIQKHEYLKIFRELVNNECLDINAQQDVGISALMIACEF